MSDRITLDFETRSAAELKHIGAYNYARHPSTEPMCLAYTFNQENAVGLWTPGFEDRSRYQGGAKQLDLAIARTKASFKGRRLSKEEKERELHLTEERWRPADIAPSPHPSRLAKAIEAGAEVEAHNAFFERNIWTAIMVPRFGFPEVRPEQWRCSAAKAATYSLPGALEKACAALGLSEQKDMVGHRLMKKLIKPRNPTLKDSYQWHQRRADLLRLFAYCIQDVRAERALSNFLLDLSPEELAVYQLDQDINLRGVHVDLELARKAIDIEERATQALWAKLSAVTSGAVTKTTERRQMIEWMHSRGVAAPIKVNANQEEIETTEAKSLKKMVRRKEIADPTCLEAVQIWLAAGKTASKKYKAMISRASADGKLRENFQFHAASTGRWGGRGVQLHNLPRPPGDWEGAMDELANDLMAFDYETLAALYGERRVPELLGTVTRGALVSSPGRLLDAPDYAAIEARGIAWIARDEPLLEIFRKLDADPKSKEDLYTWQASQLLGRTITKKDKMERQVYGKTPYLGAQYQMWAPKLQATAADAGTDIDIETCTEIIVGWRQQHKPIVDFWYETERCAIEAVQRARLADRVVVQDYLRWKMVGRFLVCKAPSGRCLFYLDPRVEWRTRTFADGSKSQPKLVLTFMGRDTYTHQWTRLSTYGGKLTQNIIERICRDLLADAMVRLAKKSFDIVLHSHDECVIDRPDLPGLREEIAAEMVKVPAWAPGFPIKVAQDWFARRYRK